MLDTVKGNTNNGNIEFEPLVILFFKGLVSLTLYQARLTLHYFFTVI